MRVDVLLVDDEPVFLSTFAEGLKSITGKTCNIITAKNGREALDILRTVTVDVVVTDLHMPDMNGLELVECMKKEHPEIAVIVASAFMDANIELTLRRLLVEHVIDKPLNLKEVTHTIMTVGHDPAVCDKPHKDEQGEQRHS
jgi:two-component system, response regulator YesN